MFDGGTEGFDRKMSAPKYVAIAKTCKATAMRDLQGLVNRGVLVAIRETSYPESASFLQQVCPCFIYAGRIPETISC